MVSRRNFFAITIIMAITFFLFQFLNIAKEKWNDYETNSYVEAKDELAGKDDMYQADSQEVIYVGDADASIGSVVADWGIYMKKGVQSYTSVSEMSRKEQFGTSEEKKMVVIESADVNWENENEIAYLKECVENGYNLIFSSLPDIQVLKSNKDVRSLLGIQDIKKESTTVKGLQLYEGFLIGGETIYQADTKEEKKKQDMELTFPWLSLESGTKVYMKGIPKDKSLKPEEYPVVIWRKSYGKAYVFAVNGSYMEDATGLGMLTAMLSEMNSYTIYPVVNAQNLVIANYPGLAEENDEVMQEMYSQSVRGVFRDIVWPTITSVYERNNMGLTFMLSPQLDYEDHVTPIEKDLRYYLKNINEETAEAGLSGDSVSNTSIQEKLKADESLVRSEMPEYQFSSFYQGELSEAETKTALRQPLLNSVKTVVKKYDGESDLIGYENQNVTSQKAVIDGFEHTYRQDFRMRSIETALGYSSVLADMSRVVYPESEKDGWEKLSEKFSANTNTYWQKFEDFDGTTVSECDDRIRNFLSLEYKDERKNDIITMEKKGVDGTAWFILRTHNEEIDKIVGGSYKKIEDDVWLIQADSNTVVMKMKSSDEKKYY